MTRAEERIGATGEASPGALLSRLRAWWRARSGLEMIEPHELDRIAGDVGITASELRRLAARGEHSADELHDRMRLLGIGKEGLENVAPGLMRDMERTCAFCTGKSMCRADLAERPAGHAWETYCPNAEGLTSAKAATDRIAA